MVLGVVGNDEAWTIDPDGFHHGAENSSSKQRARIEQDRRLLWAWKLRSLSIGA